MDPRIFTSKDREVSLDDLTLDVTLFEGPWNVHVLCDFSWSGLMICEQIYDKLVITTIITIKVTSIKCLICQTPFLTNLVFNLVINTRNK